MVTDNIGRRAAGRGLSKLSATGLLAAAARHVAEGSELNHSVADETAHLRFLVDVQSALLAQPNFSEIHELATSAMVPALASLAVVDLLDEAGGLRRVARVKDGDQAMAGRLAANAAVAPVWRVLASGVAETTTADAAFLAALFEPKTHNLVRDLPAGQAHLLPLVARGRRLGVLTLVQDDATPLGDAPGLVGVVVDAVAMALDNAQRLREAQRAVHLREDVLAVVAHDLKNPIGSVLLGTTLLRRKSCEAKAQDKILLNMQHAAERMSHMVETLLDGAAGATMMGVRAPVSVSSLVRGVFDMFETPAAQRGLSLREDIAEDLPLVYVDRERVLRVFANVVGNSLKFTPSGGTITVRATRLGADVHICIEDDGQGIPSDELPRIFDRLWHTPSGGGSGLGLYIARGIVEAHGGRMWAESQPGRGARISFTLPSV